jgi:hypothetical protein
MRVNNMEDLLDSRDIIAELERLQDERTDLTDAISEAQTVFDECDTGEDAREDARELLEDAKKELEEWEGENQEELEDLIALEKEASGAPDWPYGTALVRDSCFERYAQEWAEDTGMVPDNLTWPYTCIDWERAARELQPDYMAVEYGSVTYWIRG